MADPRSARPVSGEIMTDNSNRQRLKRVRAERDDMVEAEFELVAAPEVAAGQAVKNADEAPIASSGMDMLSGRGEAVRRPAFQHAGPAFWIVGLALAIAAFWVSGGHAIVSQSGAPFMQHAPPALVLSDIVSRVDVSGPKPVLFVDGQAANPGGATAVLTKLEIEVTGKDDRVTRYNLGTSGRTLGPGEKFAFSSRLDVPKNGVKSVTVRFAE